MKKLLLMVLVLGLAAPCLAVETYVYGWEDPTVTVLGMYGTGDPPMIVTNVGAPDPVYAGERSLKLEDNSPSGTPQAFVAWIKGLEDGDVITVGFWRYDVTPGASPSCRIWGHWNDNPDDITGYNGSASGNGDYGPGEGWDFTSYTWTVVDGHTGLVIECRTYSSAGHTVWIDDLTVELPDGSHAAGIELYLPDPDYPVATDDSTWSQIKSLY